MNHKVIVSLLFLVVFTLPGVVFAEKHESIFQPNIRFGAPLTGIKLWSNNVSGNYTIAEVELSSVLFDIITLEGFAQSIFAIMGGFGHSWGARVGYQPPSIGTIFESTAYLIPLVGYSYVKHPLSTDAGPVFFLTDNIQAGVAFDTFTSNTISFTTRLLCVYEYAMTGEKVKGGFWEYIGDRELFTSGIQVSLLLGVSWK